MNDFYIAPQKPDEIYHYGIKGRSGRYPWGSGDRPYQRLEKRVGKLERKVERTKKREVSKNAKKLRSESYKRAQARMIEERRMVSDIDEIAEEEYKKLVSDQSKELSSKNKKRISKEYERAYEKGRRDSLKNFQRLYDEAEEKAIERIEEKEIDDFDRKQKKAFGEGFKERAGYDADLEDLFYRIQKEEHEKLLDDFVRTNKYYNLAETISKKFKMRDWNDTARFHGSTMDDLKKLAKKVDRG